VLKSTFAGESASLDLSYLVVDEVTVVGSRCGPFAPALRLLESGRVQVLPLIQACYSLGDAVAALEHAGKRGVLKVLVRPDAR
jgi:threonine dehydrogenase-like Zn-dependent dehydrogenase